MGASEETAGHRLALSSQLRRIVSGAAAAGLFVAGVYMLPAADAAGETRTMTLYSVNTKERLTTTYMVNGSHVRSELAKINHLLRDWRRDAVTKMDPKTIDLMWELHADLGSKAPIHIISGYRSVETNAMLRKIGRNVAKQSMHTQGRAIDLYFPDVPTERLRNSALVRDVGGVGFYPRSGSSGFVHIDSGRVRHWPGIGSSQIARIRRDYRQTIGARLGRQPAVMVASAEDSPGASAVKKGYPTPTPRPRPIEVLMMAAAQTTIEPAAAPAPRQNFAKPPSPVQDNLGRDIAAVETAAGPRSNIGAKGSLTALRDGIAAGLPVIRPIGASASAGAQEILSWPARLLRSAESLVQRDGQPQPFGSGNGSGPIEASKDPFPPITDEDVAELEVIIAALSAKADYDARSAHAMPAGNPGKGDLLTINRSAKGDLILTAPPPRYAAASAVQPVSQAAIQTFEKLLHTSDQVE